MLVCVCRMVSDREVHAAMARGASTVGELAKACGAGTECGSCCELLQALLRVKREALHATELHEPVSTRELI
jgi:bacterioferritin-associated ferredoxin